MSNNRKFKLLKFINVMAVLLPLFYTWVNVYLWRMEFLNPSRTTFLVMCIFAALYITCVHVYDGFLMATSRIAELVLSQILSVLIADGIIYLFICVIRGILYRPVPMMGVVIVQMAAIVLWCYFGHKWYVSKYKPYRTLFVQGDEDPYKEFRNEYQFRAKFDIQRTVTPEEMMTMDERELQSYNTVIMSGVPIVQRNYIITECYRRDVGIYMLPDTHDMIWHGAKQMTICHHLMMRVYHYEDPFFLLSKRVMDVFFSALALLLLSPLMLATAAAIHLEDGGPVFYRQRRLTRDGKPFDIVKFRSMRVDAEKDGVARLSTGTADDRVTKVGRFIRMVRIDELPQLINILQGDMSIVGPRPERPELTEEYARILPEFKLRLKVKAGLTGYAQVYGKYNTTPHDKLMMDLEYILDTSMWKDVKLMFATLKILFSAESTEGIAQGKTTAMRDEDEGSKTA